MKLKRSKIIKPNSRHGLFGWEKLDALAYITTGRSNAPATMSHDMWAFRPWHDQTICTSDNGCIPSKHNRQDTLWCHYLWQQRVDFLITRFCFDVWSAQTSFTNTANQFIDNVLKECPDITCRSNSFEGVRSLIPVMEANRRILNAVGHSCVVEMATGPWSVINAADYSMNLNAGFMAHVPGRLKGEGPLQIARDLHVALDEIANVGLPMGFAWDSLDLHSLAMMYEVAATQLRDGIAQARAAAK